MARKSKGNFNLKGHSIPGIKGFKNTTLEDGRAASSAFQMEKSPLHETGLESGNLDFAKEELGEQDKDYMSRTQLAGQSGVNYALAQAQRLAQARKERKEDGVVDAGEMGDKINEYKTTEIDPNIEHEIDPNAIPLTEETDDLLVDLPKVEEKTTKPYEVQSGDNLSKIAKANNMTLEELLEKNPEYKKSEGGNPNFVRRGATINL